MTSIAPSTRHQAPGNSQAPSLNGRGSRVEGRAERGEQRSSKFDVRRSMSDVRCPVLSLLLLGLWTLDFGLWTAAAQSTNTPSRPDYSAFRILTERNIFNPRRSPRYAPRERAPSASLRLDSFALVGTMSYEKGWFAFFDGSNSDYRKVLKQDDTIAGFKVADIEPSYVKLTSPTNQVELHVGKQLRHEDDGEWRVSDRPESTGAGPVSSISSRLPDQAGLSRQALGAVRPNEPFSTNAVAGALPGPDGEQLLDLADPQQPPAATEPAAPSGGSENDVLERLRRRAAAERGENPQ